MEISVRTAIFLVSDLLLSELQKGAEIVDVNIGDKVSIRQNGDAISLYVGDKIVTTGGEIKNHFRFHHEARRKLTPLAKEVFEKIVKGADFGTSYIDDIPHMLRYYFPKLDERVRESYASLLQSLSWMLRTGAFEWTVA